MLQLGRVPTVLAVVHALAGYSTLEHYALPALSVSASGTACTTLTRTRGCAHCVISACK